MENKIQNFNIVFRKDKDGDITAVFLDDKFNDDYKLTCYAHIGQHGGCCISWLYHNTKPAKLSEYESLLKELITIYNMDEKTNLTVKNRLPSYEKTCQLFRRRA